VNVARASRHTLPPPLQGFEKVNRYWDTGRGLPAAKILPGEYYVTNSREMITTVLGSCVSACIRDRIFGVGGMNHFMLPISNDGKGWGGADDILSTATRYGNFAMEHMINEILKHGGHKRHLEAKIFGGARIVENLSDVGERNIEFVRCYLETEGIDVVGESVGDIHPRKLVYLPATGKAYVKRIKHLHNDTVTVREERYRSEISHQPVGGDVELF
jgi:chemotaxis protein CheD